MPAPITSYGYAGTIAPNLVWAKMQFALSQRSLVHTGTQLLTRGVSGAGRQVVIARGTFGGWGILDELTQDYTFSIPGSGAGWWLIVARRKWGTTQKTDFVAINAGNGASLPSRSTSWGVEDDQPIAMVQVRSDNTIGTIRDLRLIGYYGNFSANDALVRSYCLWVGFTVRIGGIVYRGVTDASGNSVWVADPNPNFKSGYLVQASGSQVVSLESGWAVGKGAVYAHRYGNVVEISLDITRTGATINAGKDNGGFSDQKVGTLTEDWRPYGQRAVSGYYVGGDAAADRGSYGGMLSINSNGSIYLCDGSPNMHLQKRTDGERSLVVSDTFIQR